MRLWLLGNYSAGNVYVMVDFEPHDPNTVTIGFYWVKGSDVPPASGTTPQDSKTFQRGVSEVRQVYLPNYGEGVYYVYYTLDGGYRWYKLGEYYLFDSNNVVVVTTANPVCVRGTGVAIVNYGGRLWVNYNTVPIVVLPKQASHAVVEVWCGDTNKIAVELFRGPFSSDFSVTPDITPPVAFMFDVRFSGSITDDQVDVISRYLGGIASNVGIYKVSSDTIRVVISKAGPGAGPLVYAAIALAFIFGLNWLVSNVGLVVTAFENLVRQIGVWNFINDTMPRILDRYYQQVDYCSQISDTEVRTTCLKAASYALDAALNAANNAARNSSGGGGGGGQQSVSNLLSQNLFIVALAFLVVLLLARR